MPSAVGTGGQKSRKPAKEAMVAKIVIRKEKGKLSVLKDQKGQEKESKEEGKKRVSDRSTKAKSIIAEPPSELDLPRKKLPKLRISLPTTTAAPSQLVRPPVEEVIDPVCPICRQIISGDMNDVNLHIDGCLDPRSESEDEAEMTHHSGPVVAADELDALPMGTINIEGDESRYGAPQYTVADVQRIIREARKGLYKCCRDDEELLPIKDTDSREALLQRIARLEARLESSGRCLICLDSFVNPVVSTVCWHVCCEVCWCQTLGSKRLCPQCNRITSPDDLRRIYF